MRTIMVSVSKVIPKLHVKTLMHHDHTLAVTFSAESLLHSQFVGCRQSTDLRQYLQLPGKRGTLLLHVYFKGSRSEHMAYNNPGNCFLIGAHISRVSMTVHQISCQIVSATSAHWSRLPYATSVLPLMHLDEEGNVVALSVLHMSWCRTGYALKSYAPSSKQP